MSEDELREKGFRLTPSEAESSGFRMVKDEIATEYAAWLFPGNKGANRYVLVPSRVRYMDGIPESHMTAHYQQAMAAVLPLTQGEGS